MKYRPLGSNGLQISELSFGAGPVAWLMTSNVEQARQCATIQRALEAGINWFDTAATYGAGQSEINLGAALRELGAVSSVHVATKVRLSPEQLSQIKSSVKESVHASLRRLGLPRVTLIQLHNSITRNRDNQPSSITPGDVLGEGGVLDAFTELKTEGLVDCFGLTGLGDAPALLEVIKAGPWAAMQLNENILHPCRPMRPRSDSSPSPDIDLIAACAGQGIGIIAIRVYAGGALAGQPPSAHTLTTKFFPLELYQCDEQKARQLEKHLPRGMTVKELALRYVLSDAHIATALIGFAGPDQIDEAVGYASAGPLPMSCRQILQQIWMDE